MTLLDTLKDKQAGADVDLAGRPMAQRPMHWIVCLAAIAMFLPAVRSIGAEQTSLEVVTPRGAREPTKFAAAELARYLGEITGGEIAVAEGGKGAWVVSTTENKMVPSTIRERLRDRGPEAYVMEALPEGIFLVGNSPRAVVYACYHFLEKYLGCRWYTPDPAEEIVPRKSLADVMALSKADIRDLEEPDFSVRMWRYLVYDLGPAGTPLADEVMRRLGEIVAWMPKLRLNILQFALDHNWDCYSNWDGFRAVMPELRRRGLEAAMGGHCLFMFIGDKEFQQHPDWRPFGKSKVTRRNRVQFCTRQPDAVEYYVNGLVAFLKANPEITYFAPWPNDGAGEAGDGWCTCPRCAGTPIADRHFELGTLIHQRLRAAVPHVRYTHFAYGNHSAPPAREKPLPGMTVTLCTWGRDYSVPFNDLRTPERFRREFSGWRDICRQTGATLVLHEKYARLLRIGLRLLPLPTLAEDLRFYRKEGVAGFELPCAYTGWWSKSLNWVALARLMWHTETDVQALTQEFFSQFYAPCAKEAAEIYALTESAQADYRYWALNSALAGRQLHAGDKPGGLLPSAERAAEGLGQAHQRAQALCSRFKQDPTLSRRLEHLETTLDYAFCEFSAMREIARGAAAAVGAEKISAPDAYRAQLAVASQHFKSAGRFDLVRQRYALQPEDFGLIWDLTGEGSYAVYQSKIIPAWLRLLAVRQREKKPLN